MIPRSGRRQAERLFPSSPCELCGKKGERHHINGDPIDNRRENISFLCRRCHMAADGRLEVARAFMRTIQPIGTAAARAACLAV
jgi:hypothetical protein